MNTPAHTHRVDRQRKHVALILNEEQLMLKESASSYLADKAPIAQLRSLRDARDEAAYSTTTWIEMVEMGWAGIAIPESYGGIGYGYTGLGIVLEQIGRNLTASPMNANVLIAATVVLKAGSEAQKQSLLAAVAAGETLLALALEESGHHRRSGFATQASATADGYVLSGHKRFVIDGGNADQLIVAADCNGETGLFIVDAKANGVSRTSLSMADSRNSAEVVFDNVSVSADARLEGAEDALEEALAIINVGICAELLGLSLKAFEDSVDYLKEREQFGVMIGSFQGLQHRAAHLFCELELAKSIVLSALQSIDAGAPGLDVLASACKAKVCEVAQLASNEAIQMHGGVGMTDEFDMGFYIKRARSLEYSFGDRNYHLDRFATLSGY